MNTQVLTISSDGQISISADIRRLLSIETSMDEAKEWAASVGYKESDVDAIIKSVRKRKKDMKIVVDTNVLISGVFFWGFPRKVISSIVNGKFIACAKDANVLYIVSGGKDLFILGKYENIQIVIAKRFCEEYLSESDWVEIKNMLQIICKNCKLYKICIIKGFTGRI